MRQRRMAATSLGVRPLAARGSTSPDARFTGGRTPGPARSQCDSNHARASSLAIQTAQNGKLDYQTIASAVSSPRNAAPDPAGAGFCAGGILGSSPLKGRWCGFPRRPPMGQHTVGRPPGGGCGINGINDAELARYHADPDAWAAEQYGWQKGNTESGLRDGVALCGRHHEGWEALSELD